MDFVLNMLRSIFFQLVALLMTEDYLNERAARGSREAFESALAKAADVEADEQDRL